MGDVFCDDIRTAGNIHCSGDVGSKLLAKINMSCGNANHLITEESSVRYLPVLYGLGHPALIAHLSEFDEALPELHLD